jgi:hypothetical protein
MEKRARMEIIHLERMARAILETGILTKVIEPMELEMDGLKVWVHSVESEYLALRYQT